jgi:hypothetical protein
MLLTFGLDIQKTIAEGRKFRFFFNKERASPYVSLWNTGKPVPVSDMRMIFQAIETFNSAVHDGVR